MSLSMEANRKVKPEKRHFSNPPRQSKNNKSPIGPPPITTAKRNNSHVWIFNHRLGRRITPKQHTSSETSLTTQTLENQLQKSTRRLLTNQTPRGRCKIRRLLTRVALGALSQENKPRNRRGETTMSKNWTTVLELSLTRDKTINPHITKDTRPEHE
ncbi:unnamed protein product [Arabis nemorensis]|uniref:Uncharacterized protein n=1 Tax=Arabis nemorensis TaxID=586526 RepID=A0A565ARU4_9BRAS|nr:unnamed protein product [Arabis nemorensis]